MHNACKVRITCEIFTVLYLRYTVLKHKLLNKCK